MNKKITLTLNESDVIHLSLAATGIRYDFEREAAKAASDQLREDKTRSAAMWKRIHDEIRSQYKAQKED